MIRLIQRTAAVDGQHAARRDPGDTEMTRTAGASARASDWVMLSRAAFEAQYMILLPMAVRAAIEERRRWPDAVCPRTAAHRR